SGIRCQVSGVREDKADARTQNLELETQNLKPKAAPSTPLDGSSLLTAIVEKIDDPRITSKLSQAMPLLKENVLTLTFNSNEAELFAEPIRNNSHLIEQIASDILKSPVKLKIDILTKKIIRKKDLKDKVLTDPAVKEVIELFDGRIIDVKLKENTGGENKDV
ncbi:MAG: hypothetical protein L6245_04185, partial [Thermodesulfovibrionales bacterium]|nr:hypothetical protein [Thermodesulfovibrionales bacterium]